MKDTAAAAPRDSTGHHDTAGQGAPDQDDERVIVAVDGVDKVFADGTHALKDVSLHVRDNEFVAIIGPSGCGKSTLLRAIAGLTAPTSGTCRLADGVEPAFVFQQPTLLPWRTAERNAELLLRLAKVPRAEARRRAHAAMGLVSLTGFEKAYPRALSGGMRMRLSLARSLAMEPDLFLLDEPFSALDEITRKTLNDELARIWYQQPFTAVLVTHNLYEAIFLASRVIVMSARPGRIQSEIEVPLPYPRTSEVRLTSDYITLVEQLSIELEKAAA